MNDADIFRLGEIILLALIAASLTYFTLIQYSLKSCMMAIALFNGWMLWSALAQNVTILNFPSEVSRVGFEFVLLILVIFLLFWMLHVTKDQEGISVVTDSKTLSSIATTSVLYILPFIPSYIVNGAEPSSVAQYVALFLVWGWNLAMFRLMGGHEIVVRPPKEDIEAIVI